MSIPHRQRKGDGCALGFSRCIPVSMRGLIKGGGSMGLGIDHWGGLFFPFRFLLYILTFCTKTVFQKYLSLRKQSSFPLACSQPATVLLCTSFPILLSGTRTENWQEGQPHCRG